MIFFDTNVITHGIQNVGAPGEEAKSVMAKAYLAHLFESGVKLALPTPALAEYLIGIPSEDHERTRLVLERNFLMTPSVPRRRRLRLNCCKPSTRGK